MQQLTNQTLGIHLIYRSWGGVTKITARGGLKKIT